MGEEEGEPLIKPKKDEYFITRMSRSMQTSQMDEDIYFSKARDNKKVNAGPETWMIVLYSIIIGFIAILVWIFSPIGILFISGMIVLFISSNKGARIFGWIAECVSLAILFLIELIFFIFIAINGSWNYIINTLLITGLIIILIILLFIIIELKLRKKE